MAKSKNALLGRFLQKGRLKMKLSQCDVAKFLGYSSGQIVSNWERGEQDAPEAKTGDISKLYQFDDSEKRKFIELKISAQVIHMARELKLKGGVGRNILLQNILSR